MQFKVDVLFHIAPQVNYVVMLSECMVVEGNGGVLEQSRNGHILPSRRGRWGPLACNQASEHASPVVV